MWRIFVFYDKITLWRAGACMFGAVAEWLRRGLQNLVHRFNSGRRLHEEARSPLGTRRAERSEARMAELVYAFDLKSNGETRTGSSPVPATK